MPSQMKMLTKKLKKTFLLLVPLLLTSSPTHVHTTQNTPSKKHIISTIALMFLTNKLNKHSKTTQNNNLLNTIKKLKNQPNSLTQQEKNKLNTYITQQAQTLNLLHDTPNQKKIHQELINLKQQLPLLHKNTVPQLISRPHELPIPADGNCLYKTITLSYLLPVLNNTNRFNQNLYELTNLNNPLITPQQLAGNYYNIPYLHSDKTFQRVIHRFLKKINIKPGTWGGPKEIGLIAEKLNINIQEYTPDPDNPQNLIKSDLTQPQTWLSPPKTTIHIVQDTPLPQELITSNQDPGLQQAKHRSLQTPQHRHHYRLHYTGELPQTPKADRNFLTNEFTKWRNIYFYKLDNLINKDRVNKLRLEHKNYIASLINLCQGKPDEKQNKIRKQYTNWISQKITNLEEEIKWEQERKRKNKERRKRQETIEIEQEEDRKKESTQLQQPSYSNYTNTNKPLQQQNTLTLNLPYITYEHQQRIIAHLTLSQSTYLPTIIQLLNKKLGPIQDEQQCKEIGDYLASIGHFYLSILQNQPPKNWVTQSLKLDIARNKIQKKDTLALNLFHEALEKYQTKTTPNQFLKTLYTLYNYTKEPNTTLFHLTTLLNRLIDKPHTKLQPTTKDTFYALQKAIIKNTLIKHQHFNNYQKNEIIDKLYQLIKAQNLYPNNLLQKILNLINKQKSPKPTLDLLNLIKQKNIHPTTLKEAFQLAQKYKITSLDNYQKILYYLLLKQKINTTCNITHPSIQNRINPPLWKLIVQPKIQDATLCFKRLYNLWPQEVQLLFTNLCQLADYTPPSSTYTKTREILLKVPSINWLKEIHQLLLKTTFSKPHELSVQQILDEIQQSAQQENTTIDIHQITQTYQQIQKEYQKDQSSLQEIQQRIQQYQQKALQRKKEETSLHIACSQGDLPVVKHIVQNNKNIINIPNKRGSLPIHYAAKKGHLHILTYLIQQKADPTKTNDIGNTCVHYACYENSVETIQWLLKNTSINPKQPNKSQYIPLDYAVGKGRLKAVQYLLHHIKKPFSQAKKALQYANQKKHPYIIHHLKKFTQESIKERIQQYEQELKNNNPNQDTLLHLACKQGDLATVKYLIEVMKVSIKVNADGDTPLHYAAEKDHLPIVQYLCEYTSTNPQAKNINGQTPLYIAKKKNHHTIVNYLKNLNKPSKTNTNFFQSKNIIAQWNKSQILQWAKNYKKATIKPSLSQTLAVIKRAIQLHKGFLPRSVQLLALLALYQQQKQKTKPKGRLAQIMTGQGKSITIAMLAILHALQGHKVDIITTSPELSQREAKNQASLFALFGLTVAENSKEKDPSLISTLQEIFSNQYNKNPYKSQIVYGTPKNFEADILRTEFSGQKEVRAGRELDIVIIDETDSLQVDQRKHSTYLGDDTPGMQLLQLPLATVWNRVNDIHDHIITQKDGTHHYITQDFEKKDEQIILHTADPNTKLEDCMIRIEKDKDDFIIELAQQELQDLFRKPTKEEINALQAIEQLEEQITLAYNLLHDLKEQNLLPTQKIKQQEQAIQKLENKRKNSTWYQKEYTTYIELPDYLREHVQNELPEWIKNALYARCYFHKDQQYSIKEDKIAPVDHANTGVIQQNLVWSHGLSQFLSIKHDLPFNPSMLTTNYMSNLALFTRYKTIYGLTGTLGEKTSKKFLRTTYNVDCLTIPPHIKRTIQGNTNPNLPCKKLKTYLCKTPISHTYAIAQTITQHITLGRSILIICPYIQTVEDKKVFTIKKLAKNLQKTLPIKKITTYTGQTKFNKKTIGPQEILIATNIAGRGFDPKTTLELEKNGGMHVMIIFNPQNTRVEAQNMGRTARSGKLGTAQLIIYDPDTPTIKQLQQKRNTKEKEAMQKALEDVDYIRFKDSLFQEFCQLLNQLFPDDNITFHNRLDRELMENLWKKCRNQALEKIQQLPKIKDLINEQTWQAFVQRKKQPNKPNWGAPTRDSLKEQFGLFLCSVEKLLEEKNYKLVKEKFQNLIKQIQENAKQDNLPQNPYYHVLEGNLYARSTLLEKVLTWVTTIVFDSSPIIIQGDRLDKALIHYQRAINQDPILALHAYYNQAYILFLQSKTQQATTALKNAKKCLSTYYKPRLFTLHHLITQKGTKKTISAQVQRQLNLLLLVDDYIDNALNTVQYAQDNNKEIIINNHTHIKEIIENRAKDQKNTPLAQNEDIEKFTINGLTNLFTLKAIDPFPTGTVLCLLAISVGEIVIGGIIIVYSGGTANKLGYAILQEGISDLIQTAKVAHSREFDWQEWGIQKGITIAIGIASAGINHIAKAKKLAKTTKQSKGLINISKEVTKDIKNYFNIGASDEAEKIYSLFKQTIKLHLTKGIAKECLNTLVDYTIEKILYNHLEQIIIYLIKPIIQNNLKNNTNLLQALQIDNQNKNNLYQNQLLQQATDILQGSWSSFFADLVHNLLQGKSKPEQNKTILSKIGNIRNLYTFLRGLGVKHIGNKTIQTLEGILAGIDCVTYTHNFNKEFTKSIKQQTKHLKKNNQQPSQQPFFNQQPKQYTSSSTNNSTNTTTHIAPSPTPNKTSPYTPRSNLPHQEQKTNTDDQEPIQLQEDLYTPSSPSHVINTISDNIAQHITRQIHQKGFKPVTSHYINKGVDGIVEKEEKELNEKIKNQQQKNRLTYALNDSTKKPTSKLNIPENPQNEIQQIAKAIAEGAEGDILSLTMLANAKDLTLLIYSPEGELLAIKGNGKKQGKATYTPPSEGQSGHWQAQGIKNYPTTGPTNCLFDTIAALTGNKQTSQELRQYCARHILHNANTLTPIINDYYTLSVLKPQAIYTGAGVSNDIITLAMKGERIWEEFKKNHPWAVSLLKGVKKGIGTGLFMLGAGTTIATGGAAGLASVMLSAIGAYAVSRLCNYVIQHNQGKIEGGKKWLAQGLKKLDSDLTNEKANWAADKLMSLLIEVGRMGAQYLGGRLTSKVYQGIKTNIQTTTHRKQHIQNLAKKQPTKLKGSNSKVQKNSTSNNKKPNTKSKTAPKPSNKSSKRAPKDGLERAKLYSKTWKKGSLSKAIDKFTPGTKGIKTNSGKTIYKNSKTGIQVVYDNKGNYFRIENTTLSGNRRYLDLNGNISNNKLVNNKTTGRSKEEYLNATHFTNEE